MCQTEVWPTQLASLWHWQPRVMCLVMGVCVLVHVFHMCTMIPVCTPGTVCVRVFVCTQLRVGVCVCSCARA